MISININGSDKMSFEENINQIQWYNMSDNEYKWLCNFELLKEYLKEHNGNYPKMKEIYKREKLGNWINNQRNVYNNGEKQQDGSIRYDTRILTQYQVKKLNEINFIWDYNAYIWNQNYELLKEYLKEHNGKFPKLREIYNGENIGYWINTQRVIYNNGERQKDGSIKYNGNILTLYQVKRLDVIKFIWIFNKARFRKRTIETKGQLEGARRYLLSTIEKLEKEGIKEEDLNKQLLMRL